MTDSSKPMSIDSKGLEQIVQDLSAIVSPVYLRPILREFAAEVRRSALLEATRFVTSRLAYPKDCSHDAEAWYCDSCKFAWEKSLAGIPGALTALAERKE